MCDRLEPRAHQTEGFSQTFLEGALQLLVNGLAHRFELLLVVLPKFVQLILEPQSQSLDARFVRRGEGFDSPMHPLELFLLSASEFSHGGDEGVGGVLLAFADLFAKCTRRVT